MDEVGFKKYLGNCSSITSANAVRQRLVHARKSEKILGMDLDIVVVDDDTMYKSLNMLKIYDNIKHSPLQNSVRAYYRFRNNDADFPRKNILLSNQGCSSNRIHQIKCYNVGFGDCFLCKDNNESHPKMLIDFGARKTDKEVIKDVIDELSETEIKYLMLSHLHEDHYRGLKNIKAKGENQLLQFDEIYLSDYIASGGIWFMGKVLLSTQNNTLLNFVRAILKIPALLPGYVKNDTKVYLLCQGNIVHNSLCDFEVLLPLNNNRFYTHHRGDLEELIGTFAQRYINLLNYVPYSNGETSSIQVNSDNLGEEIDHLIDDLIREGQGMDVSVNEKMLKEMFDNYHNSLSLAFHELSVPNEQNVLFLGDAEPMDIDALVQNGRFKNQYCFVKVQHHGTKNHFYNALPAAKYYAITNGKSRAGCELTALYDACYGANTTFVCSNSCNCELYKKGAPCNSATINSAICGIISPTPTAPPVHLIHIP